MVELWLVRHGQTDWNLAVRYQGQTDIPLNQEGIAQAKAIAEHLKVRKYNALYSSDLIRARKTADIIAEKVNLPVITDRRLREISQGSLEGMKPSEVPAKYPELIAWAKTDYQNWHAPGGESVRQVAERMAAVANDIARKHPGGKVLVVSHGFALATLIVQAAKLPLEESYAWIPENAEPFKLAWQGDA